MKPIRDDRDFKEAVRNVKSAKNAQKNPKRVTFKRDISLDTFFLML